MGMSRMVHLLPLDGGLMKIAAIAMTLKRKVKKFKSLLCGQQYRKRSDVLVYRRRLNSIKLSVTHVQILRLALLFIRVMWYSLDFLLKLPPRRGT